MGNFSVEIMRLPGQLSVEINKLGVKSRHHLTLFSQNVLDQIQL